MIFIYRLTWVRACCLSKIQFQHIFDTMGETASTMTYHQWFNRSGGSYLLVRNLERDRNVEPNESLFFISGLTQNCFREFLDDLRPV